MTKKIKDMKPHEMIWKAEGEAKSARRILKAGGNPDGAIGRVIHALQKYREATGI